MTEEPRTTIFKHGSCQLEFTAPCVAMLQQAIHSLEGNELSPAGPDFDTHMTIRYGVDDFNPITMKQALEHIEPITINIVDVDCFPNAKDGPCIFFKVELTEELINLRKLIEANAECCEPTFPDYIPHITIGFFKPDHMQSVIDKLRTMYQFPFEIQADNIVVSEKTGKQTNFPLFKNYAEHRIAHLIKNHLKES